MDRAEDDNPALFFQDRRWTWRQFVQASARRGWWIHRRATGGTLHIGVLMGNLPDYLFWLGGAALAGAVIVGINSTRRGDALARDVRRTGCDAIVTDGVGASLLDGLDLGAATGSSVRVDQLGFGLDQEKVVDGEDATALIGMTRPQPGDLYLLLFTSGTTGEPKAVRCTQGRLTSIGVVAAEAFGYGADDVAYCTMPLFHGNALMALWAPTLVAGGAVALAPKFSATGFVDDVHRFGATTFTYVGKALAYILATPQRADDGTCSLRRGFGTEGSITDIVAFECRFGCRLTEGYGSSEGGVAINRTPDTPPGSLGIAAPDVVVVDPETCTECPRAIFDDAGRLINGDRSVGEIVNRSGPGRFEGYYDDEPATTERTRNGWYWTGDLAYRDAGGFFYFAGRSGDWLRVDSENLTAGPIERVLVRFDEVAAVAVYPVPDPRSGDQVMAAFELLPGRRFDPQVFEKFLASQSDLGTKWVPDFVRISGSLPQTATGRVTKDPLKAEGWWDCPEPVYRRGRRTLSFHLLDGAGIEELRAEARLHGREQPVAGSR